MLIFNSCDKENDCAEKDINCSVNEKNYSKINKSMSIDSVLKLLGVPDTYLPENSPPTLQKKGRYYWKKSSKPITRNTFIVVETIDGKVVSSKFGFLTD